MKEREREGEREIKNLIFKAGPILQLGSIVVHVLSHSLEIFLTSSKIDPTPKTPSAQKEYRTIIQVYKISDYSRSPARKRNCTIQFAAKIP